MISHRDSSPTDLFSPFSKLPDSFSDMILPKSELKGYFQPWMKLVGGGVGIIGGATICGGGGKVVSGLGGRCSGAWTGSEAWTGLGGLGFGAVR